MVPACGGGGNTGDEPDCAGTPGGTAYEDQCGVCDDDPTNDCVADCAGTLGGTASVDNCGTCDTDPTNDCVADCAGTLGGTASVDNCGTCDTDPSNDCTQDCAGTWGGSATVDNCGTCDTDPSNDCTQDCAGTWDGTAIEDHCGTCDTDPSNDCTQDCAGTWGGSATVDSCGTCDTDPSNDCTQDCAGTWGGSATVDSCGTCDTDPSNDCTQDCAGTWDGTAIEDHCGTCDTDPGNDCTQDCAGTWGGTAYEDICGTCDTDPANDCVQDCEGTWGGTAYEDMCGTCDTDPANDCVQDCEGTWGGTAYEDMCSACIDRDAAPAALLYSEPNDRFMYSICEAFVLPSPLLVEEVYASVQADTSAISDAWVYLKDESNATVASLRYNPANFGTVSGTTVLGQPMVIAGYSVCSWWNAAILRALDFYGDADACTMDCLGDWGGAAYRDTCNTCIDRDAAPAVLLYSEPTDRLMNATCAEFVLPNALLVEELYASVGANSSAISDAWVYLKDQSNTTVATLRYNPANFGIVSGTTVLDQPVVIAGYSVCSWWNAATLRALDFFGDAGACLP